MEGSPHPRGDDWSYRESPSISRRDSVPGGAGSPRPPPFAESGRAGRPSDRPGPGPARIPTPPRGAVSPGRDPPRPGEIGRSRRAREGPRAPGSLPSLVPMLRVGMRPFSRSAATPGSVPSEERAGCSTATRSTPSGTHRGARRLGSAGVDPIGGVAMVIRAVVGRSRPPLIGRILASRWSDRVGDRRPGGPRRGGSPVAVRGAARRSHRLLSAPGRDGTGGGASQRREGVAWTSSSVGSRSRREAGVGQEGDDFAAGVDLEPTSSGVSPRPSRRKV